MNKFMEMSLQVKIPRVVNKVEYLQFLLDHVIG